MTEETEELPASGDLDLPDEWRKFGTDPWGRMADFREYLRTLISDPDAVDEITFCESCNNPGWGDDMYSASSNNVTLCASCYEDWHECYQCEDRFPADSLTETLDENSVCNRCIRDYYSYCEHCNGYRHDNDDNHDHDDDDDDCCYSPQQAFTVRNDGESPLKNDTRISVTLPAGYISDEGICAIARYLRQHDHFDLSFHLGKLGNQWQEKGGNYAKRLSRLAYTDFQVKLSPEVMSQIGCIARDHSNQVSVTIDITRDLNQSAGYFYHGDSCWWRDYRESRCALKTNGGFGMRSFDDRDSVSGRAWVLPLKADLSGKLYPTFNTITPDAFVVFNGYGALSGYTGARILSHMTGWTYRKISFDCSPMYINAGGYLIAPEDIASKYTDGSLHLSVSRHARLHERELANA